MRPRVQGRGGLGSRKQDSKEQTISEEAYAFGEANNFGEADALGERKSRAEQEDRTERILSWIGVSKAGVRWITKGRWNDFFSLHH